MSGGDAYRDDLAAAQARIANLEKLVAADRGASAQARTVAALLAERARIVGGVEPPHVWSRLRYFFVVFGVVAIAFAADHDWLFASLAVAAPFLMGFIGQRFVVSNAAASARQLALIDERLRAIEATGAQDP